MLKYGLAALAMVAGPAMAQDAPTFAGPYVGVQAGWGERSADESFDIPGVADLDASRSGLDYGAYVGFNAPVGTSFIVGGEAEIGGGGKAVRSTLAPGIEASIDPKWNYAVSGRAGFIAGDSALIYGRLGYAAERVRIGVDDSRAGGSSFRDSGWSDGLMAGGGVEYAFSSTTSLRAEYRFKNLDGSYESQQLLAGLSFAF